MDRELLKRSLKAGFFGGVVAVFISMIGMVESFSERSLVVGSISIGHTLVIIVMMVTGYLTARANRNQFVYTQSEGVTPSLRSLLFGSLVAGVIVGASLSVLS